MKIPVLGIATTKFGELWGVSPRELVRSAVGDALRDAHMDISEIDGIFVGNMLSGILGNQENLGAFYAEELGVSVPAVKVEGACASGGLAVHMGVLGILSGQYERVLVVGVEKMTDHNPEQVAAALMGAGSDGERIAGLTFPGLYALMAVAYKDAFGLLPEHRASVPVKNHFHASKNPNAHFRNTITAEQVMKSPLIADPLTLLDCSPVSDGASAIVLGNESLVSPSSVQIVVSTVATDTLDLAHRKSLTSLSATKTAAVQVYNASGIEPSDVHVAEVHDCFSIAEIIALEDLGFFKQGTAAGHVAEGDVTIGSSKKLVVNSSGGLKACGHPVGATGVKQIVEIVQQLRGSAGARQVKGARVGLTHNVGGSGAVAVVHILKSI